MATDGEKIGALRDFFVATFAVPELEMFLTVNGYADAAVAVNQGGGHLEYCFAVAQALQRRSLIDEVFFERLRQERPGRQSEISALRPLWLAADQEAPAPPRGTSSGGSGKKTGVAPPVPRHQSSSPPSQPVQPITLLHVSDMQFGRYHRFGRLGAFDPDASFDTLIQRLTDDLDLLKRENQLVPQLVIVSGDLAEWGLPAEFNQAREFLVKLIEHLGLERDRVIIVPGNHDINRKSCEAYFNACDADGETPVPPFWPKWKQYAHFFEEFYQGLPPPVRHRRAVDLVSMPRTEARPGGPQFDHRRDP